MSDREFIAALDIGTTKIACVVAEMEEEQLPKITGLGISPSEGLRKGVVVNLEKTIQSIIGAVDDAELMSGIKIESVFCGIAGDHIKSINSRGVIGLSSMESEINSDDVEKVIEAARALAIPQDREIIHVLPQQFSVDGQSGIKDPVGMSGVRLEAEVHIVTGAVTSSQNIYKSVKRAGLEINELVLEPLASSYALLYPEERELGVVLIDLGGGTTNIAIFYEGGIRDTAVIGLGGKNVTSDIAFGLKTPLNYAEELKKNFGCAFAPMADANEMIKVPGVGGREPRELSRSVLASIVEPRMEEIFELCLREIEKGEHLDLLTSGVVLTGGGALMEGMVELTEKVFDMPARVGKPKGFTGLTEQASSPIHSTGIGLILYGQNHNRELNQTKGGRIKKVFGNFKSWLNEYF
ncbi:MAG: cell division protein FtsA [candidate division Zixibacteria bacterium SM23_73_2]|nr:MAG: cell division protein FtsA [candidate division Zixibacteria bacterium SM23_73_2]